MPNSTGCLLAEKENDKNPSPTHGAGVWFVAQIKPGRFLEAERNLRRQEVYTFMPTREAAVKKGRQNITQRRPLFPGYIFVQFDPQVIATRTVNCTYGISRLVMRNSLLAATVPEALIAGLMERCDADGNLLPPPDFKVGETIRIISGPFQNFVVKIEFLSVTERLEVLLDILGQSVRVSVGSSDVERVSTGTSA